MRSAPAEVGDGGREGPLLTVPGVPGPQPPGSGGGEAVDHGDAVLADLPGRVVRDGQPHPVADRPCEQRGHLVEEDHSAAFPRRHGIAPAALEALGQGTDGARGHEQGGEQLLAYPVPWPVQAVHRTLAEEGVEHRRREGVVPLDATLVVEEVDGLGPVQNRGGTAEQVGGHHGCTVVCPAQVGGPCVAVEQQGQGAVGQ